MRIKELSLDRFGHFNDRKFDFGTLSDRPDFHIIYGPNEAGKTTTMEAVLRLFYGFPNREAFAFKHQRNNLQVSAKLNIDGQLRDFTRLPKRSGALVDANGTALPETALSAHLAGLTEDDYRQLLCLDDDTIERGGEEIAQAKGDIGRLLFSAAAGVADLSTVLDGVREQSDGIWKKRASKTRIAELKRDLADVEKTIRERDISASAWRSLRKVLSEAQAAERMARAARDALLMKASEVDAQKRAIPMMVEVNGLEAQIAPFADYPTRLDFDPERLVQLRIDDATTRLEVERLTGEIDKLSSARDGITLDPKQESLGGKLDALEELRIRDSAADMDLSRREDQQRKAEEAMSFAARDLGVPPKTDFKSLVLSPVDIMRLETARDDLRKAGDSAVAEGEEVAALTDRLNAAQGDYDVLSVKGAETPNVGEILSRFDVDLLAPALASARQALTTAAQSARAHLRGLAVGSVVFDSLPTCPSSVIKARDWAEQHADLRHQIIKTAESKAEHRAELAARAAQAKALTISGTLVSDATTDALQMERDSLWQVHEVKLTGDTAKTFASAMHAFDDALKSRVARARDLGQLRQVEQARAEAQARADQADTRLNALRDDLVKLENSVDAAASGVGLPKPITPSEWLDWVERHTNATDAAETLIALQETHQPVLDRAQKLLDMLKPRLPLEDPDFEDAIAAARMLAKEERERSAQRTKVHEAFKHAENDLAERQGKHQAAMQAKAQANGVWQDLIQDLLGGSIASHTMMASLEPLRNLREQEERRASAAQRVATMQSDQRRFAAEVVTLAATHEVTPKEPAATCFEALRRLSSAAQAAREKHAEVTQSIEAAQASLNSNEKMLAGIVQEVASIAAIFPESTPVDSIDAMRSAAGQAQQVITDRAEINKLEHRISSELGVADMNAAREVLEDLTIINLEAAGETVKFDLATAENGLTSATEARVTAEQGLAQVTGDADIATLTERKTTLELQLEEAALEHLELSLGHQLASEAIRRYRDSHRNGMMTATERCFASLTQGAYPKLTTLPDGSEEILLAVDRDGATKRAADMSKGTRFQLYLALRAAAHEQLVTQGTCLPFFCDDIFETFDEERTSAACRIMEDIGRKGQAIYLTHHRHVVEIAMKVCDTPPILHEI
ncbi:MULTISPECIES: YhaN family protein [Pacificibacter]|uniref:YhaN family protein n=1 Tax=Pacificibacter TaxID=1042323 RepID=UPI001C091418|nr:MULTISPECIES: YhaN family protein [Pacificibacter]MBU2936511.1 AAA family ATPase [Pacificibacter marinus]MDO6614687.1 AAA family ATPase [Pacificibacter sp. 1_MG-2023]